MDSRRGAATMTTYTFTGDQLDVLLTGTIEMFCEYLDQHDHVKEAAQPAAVLEMLEGLDAERELYQAGEIEHPSQCFRIV